MEKETKKYSAQRKYLAEKREQLQLTLPIGTKERWRAYAAEEGLSLTAYITQLIEHENEWRKRI